MASYPTRTPSGLPVPIAEGGTGAATAAAARGNLAIRSAWSATWGAAASDTVQERLSFPFDDCEVKAIHIGAIGTDATAGTITIYKEINGAGGTMLDTDPFDPIAMGYDTIVSVALTGTTADLQGDMTDGIEIACINVDQDTLITITFGPQ